MRTVYVNGEFMPEDQARISIFDRSVLFADGVYEVTAVIGRKLLEFDGHMARLSRSLKELDMPERHSRQELLDVHRALVEKNDLDEGVIYLQITRGAADRDFDFSELDAEPGLIMFTQTKNLLSSPLVERGQNIKLVEDQRWGPLGHQDGPTALFVADEDQSQERRRRRCLAVPGRNDHRGLV